MGRYRLQASEFDSTAIYVVSAEHDGIAYFTLPIRPSGEDAGTAEPLLVYDTSSTVPELHLAQRHVIVRPRSSEGTFRVLEILVLENRGRLTRISPDSVTPVWLGAIPEGAIQFQVGESDVSDQAVTRRGDSVAVIAPVPHRSLRRPGRLVFARQRPHVVGRERSVPMGPSSCEHGAAAGRRRRHELCRKERLSRNPA